MGEKVKRMLKRDTLLFYLPRRAIAKSSIVPAIPYYLEGASVPSLWLINRTIEVRTPDLGLHRKIHGGDLYLLNGPCVNPGDFIEENVFLVLQGCGVMNATVDDVVPSHMDEMNQVIEMDITILFADYEIRQRFSDSVTIS